MILLDENLSPSILTGVLDSDLAELYQVKIGTRTSGNQWLAYGLGNRSLTVTARLDSSEFEAFRKY